MQVNKGKGEAKKTNPKSGCGIIRFDTNIIDKIYYDTDESEEKKYGLLKEELDQWREDRLRSEAEIYHSKLHRPSLE